MKSNKELKEEYLQRKAKMGVYQIRNTVNGKIFLGSGLNLDAILNRNTMELNLSSHRNEALQKDWKEYGKDSFVFEILREIEHKDNELINYNFEVKKLEAMFHKTLMPFGAKGYHQDKEADKI